MEKYMGNKSKMLDFIYSNIDLEIKEENKVILDAFAGTTNVGKYFKENGYKVVSNDINDFTYALSRCYITNDRIPNFDKLISSEFYSAKKIEEIKNNYQFNIMKNDILNLNKNMLTSKFVELIKESSYIKILTYLSYIADESDYDNDFDDAKVKKTEVYGFLTRNYTEFGENSKYINLVYKKSLDKLCRKYNDDNVEQLLKLFYKELDIELLGRIKQEFIKLDIKKTDIDKLDAIINNKTIIGKRKFFSKEHGKRLDIILNTIIYWRNNKLISETEYYILLTSVIESITIFSNTSATYQAFYKEYKANTKQQFRLVIPKLNLCTSGISLKGDVFENLNKEEYDILYLDPPYNWRQYDSNYHLINTVARLNEIKDIKEFERNIIGASGENRVEKLIYTSFNQRQSFEHRLFELIKQSKCRIVAISYSDSESNHRVKESNITIDRIESFMSNEEIFEKNSFRKIEFSRQNFESRKLNKKLLVNEILLIARKGS